MMRKQNISKHYLQWAYHPVITISFVYITFDMKLSLSFQILSILL